MLNKKWSKPFLVGVLWTLVFIGILIFPRFLYLYWNRFIELFYILMAITFVVSLLYVLSMKILGRKITIMKLPLQKIIGYLALGILLIFLFNGMAAIKTDMKMAGDIADQDKVLELNAIYSILSIAAGMLMNFNGVLNMIKGNIKMNIYIVPAFILMYIGSIYLVLYYSSSLEFGISPGGIMGLVMEVFKIVELQLVFLLMSGYLLVRGFTKRL